MAATFTVQQHPRAGSVTPSLSSCSTVRAPSKSPFNWKVSLGSEWLVVFVTLFCLCLVKHGGFEGLKLGRACGNNGGRCLEGSDTESHLCWNPSLPLFPFMPLRYASVLCACPFSPTFDLYACFFTLTFCALCSPAVQVITTALWTVTWRWN